MILHSVLIFKTPFNFSALIFAPFKPSWCWSTMSLRCALYWNKILLSSLFRYSSLGKRFSMPRGFTWLLKSQKAGIFEITHLSTLIATKSRSRKNWTTQEPVVSLNFFINIISHAKNLDILQCFLILNCNFYKKAVRLHYYNLSVQICTVIKSSIFFRHQEKIKVLWSMKLFFCF